MKRGKATHAGTCTICNAPYAIGERIAWTKPVHTWCLGGSFQTMPTAPTLEITRLKALDALEETVKIAAQVNGVTDEMERLWRRYEKAREIALRPGAPGEERAAFRLALRTVIELAF